MSWKNILTSLKTFFTSFFKTAFESELKLLLPIATEIVDMVENDSSLVKNADKRSSAFALILQKLVESQKTIAPFLINLAIEIAVANMKAFIVANNGAKK